MAFLAGQVLAVFGLWALKFLGRFSHWLSWSFWGLVPRFEVAEILPSFGLTSHGFFDDFWAEGRALSWCFWLIGG